MNFIRYVFRSAFKSIWVEKWFNLLAIFAIGIGLFVLCAFGIFTINMDMAVQRWTKSFGVIVYLNDGLEQNDIEAMRSRFRKDPDIEEVTYISKDQALENVRNALGSNSLILDVFKKNPLPASFELKLKSNLLQTSYVKKKAAKINSQEGVKEVQYGEKWLSSLNTATKIMKGVAFSFGGLIFVSITFITYSIIKIFFQRRKDDIETLKLLGAPRRFIRSPLLIEGIFMGTVGGTLSALALFITYSFILTTVSRYIPSISLIVTSLPIVTYAFIPLSGTVMSLMGSLIAIGRIRY